MAAETLELFDFIRKTGTSGYVISLSGGADSTFCAILVHEMARVGCLGTEDDQARFKEAFLVRRLARRQRAARSGHRHILTCIYQNGKQLRTGPSARRARRELGARFENVGVQATVDFASFLARYLDRPLDWQRDDVTRQNIEPAPGAPALIIANAENKLNITTSNRSESAVGYCTMDGDTAGSLGPLGGLDKASILEALDLLLPTATAGWLRSAASAHGRAQTRRGQPDGREGPDALSGPRCHRARVDSHGKSPEEIVQDGIATLAQVRKFFTLFPRNQWKRGALRPSLHLDAGEPRSQPFTRFPIFSGGFGEELKRLPGDPLQTAPPLRHETTAHSLDALLRRARRGHPAATRRIPRGRPPIRACPARSTANVSRRGDLPSYRTAGAARARGHVGSTRTAEELEIVSLSWQVVRDGAERLSIVIPTSATRLWSGRCAPGGRAGEGQRHHPLVDPHSPGGKVIFLVDLHAEDTALFRGQCQRRAPLTPGARHPGEGERAPPRRDTVAGGRLCGYRAGQVGGELRQ
ncbi:MAG: hypothetical protein IPL39_20165 [Opitutaceae bacterium]|nr:hypothetical protein [Opitutaceae bacterium]